MKISESLSYDGASVEGVYAIITDPAFRIDTCEDQGATEHDVTVEHNAVGGATVTIVRSMPSDLPEFIRKITGPTVKVKQVEVWSAADGDDNRHATVHLKIIGQPAEMNGTVSITNHSSGTTFDLDGDVKVLIPFIGRKIEPEIHRAILSSVRAEVALGNKRLG